MGELSPAQLANERLRASGKPRPAMGVGVLVHAMGNLARRELAEVQVRGEARGPVHVRAVPVLGIVCQPLLAETLQAFMGIGLADPPEITHPFVPGNGRQKTQFSDEQYTQLVKANVALIPLDEYEAIGFTPEELAAYGPGGRQSLSPGDFQEKLGKARQVFLDIRARVIQGDPINVVLSSSVEDSFIDEEETDEE